MPLLRVKHTLCSLVTMGVLIVPIWAAEPAGKQAGAAKANEKAITITGIVTKPDGSPAAGAMVRSAATLWPKPHPLQAVVGDSFEPPMNEVRANGQGRFSIAINMQPFGDVSRLDREWQHFWKKTEIAASLDGFGAAWTIFEETDPKQPLTLRLVEDVAIRGKVIDLEGRPIAGATIRVNRIYATKTGDASDWIAAVKARELPLTVNEKLPRNVGARTIGIAPNLKTKADGTFEIQGIGRDRVVDLFFEGDAVAHRAAKVVAREMESLSQLIRGGGFTEEKHREITKPVFGSRFTIIAEPTQRVNGTVVDAETGKPVAGVCVESWYLAGVFYPARGLMNSVTDAKGQFRLNVPKGAGNQLLVRPSADQPFFQRVINVPNPVGLGQVTLEVKLHRGVVIIGRVTDKMTGEPVQGVRMHYLPLQTNEHTGKLPDEFQARGNAHVVPGDEENYLTGADGSYRVVGLPGPAVIGAHSVLRSFCSGIGYESIDVPRLGDNKSLLTFANPMFPSRTWPSSMKFINPEAAAKSASLDLELDPGGSVTMRLMDAGGKPVTGASIIKGLGPPGTFLTQVTDEAVATAINFGRNETRVIVIQHHDRRIGCVLRVGAKEIAEREITATLLPLAIVSGQLVKKGRPLAGIAIEPRILPPEDFGNLPSIATDKAGRFQCALPPGCDYQLFATGQGLDLFAVVVERLGIKSGESHDLKVLKLGDNRKFSR